MFLCFFRLWQEFAYALRHSRNLVEMERAVLDADTMQELSKTSYPKLQGLVLLRDELELNKLKSTFPNLVRVAFEEMRSGYIKKFCSSFPETAYLAIFGYAVVEEVLAGLSILPNLRGLHIDNSTELLANAELKLIANRLPNLEFLKFPTGEAIRDDTFQCLGTMPQLLDLEVKVSPESLWSLADTNLFPVLKIFRSKFSNCYGSTVDFEVLHKGLQVCRRIALTQASVVRSRFEHPTWHPVLKRAFENKCGRFR